jgi:hypothetical protein
MASMMMDFRARFSGQNVKTGPKGNIAFKTTAHSRYADCSTSKTHTYFNILLSSAVKFRRRRCCAGG